MHMFNFPGSSVFVKVLQEKSNPSSDVGLSNLLDSFKSLGFTKKSLEDALE